MPKQAVIALALLILASPVAAACLQNDANPVFGPPGGATWPTVVHDPALFSGSGPAAAWKMWYAKGEGPGTLLAHAVSDDGRAWTELSSDLGLGPGLSAPRVLHDVNRFGQGPSGPSYRMFVSDRTMVPYSIRLLESDDGLSWQDRGVVIDGAAEYEHLHDLAVSYRPGASGASPVESRYLGFASKGPTVTFFASDEGEVWTAFQGLTLEATHPAPLVLPDGTVRLWAEATEFSDALADERRIDQYLLKPRLDGSGYEFELVDAGLSGIGTLGASGTWDESAVGAPAVAFDGRGVHLFRTGLSAAGASSVGLATDQVFTVGDSWEPPQGARSPEVLTADGSFASFGPTVRYKLWHSNGAGTAIVHAGSVDGDKWTLLDASVEGLAPSATSIELVHDPEGFGGALLTHGYRAVYRDADSADPATAFRSARSMDGMSWFDDAPIGQVADTLFAPVSAGTRWNSLPGEPVELVHRPEAPAVLNMADPMNNRFVLVYSASDGTAMSWGLALSVDGVTWRGWQDGLEPLFSPGAVGAWDEGRLGDGAVLARPDGGHLLWYGAGGASGDRGIGFATSPDGTSWTRCPSNPILGLGGCGPEGGLGCSGPTTLGNGAPTVLIESVPDLGCLARARYRIWRAGVDAFGAPTLLSASAPAGFATTGSVLRVPEEHATIQAAIDAAGAGDTILVAAGLYEENLVIDRPLRLVGADRESTIIGSADAAAASSAVVWIQGTADTVTDCVSLENFTIHGAAGDPQRQVAIGVRTGDLDLGSLADEASWTPRNSSVVVRNCRIRGAIEDGLLVHGAMAPRIESCLIGEIGDPLSAQATSRFGIRVLASKRPVITGNSIVAGAEASGPGTFVGVALNPFGTMLWESYQVVGNSIVGPNRGGGIVLDGDFDTEPARYDSPELHLIAGNLVDAGGRGTHGLVLRGGVYGAAVSGNELRGSAINLYASRAGTPSLPVSIEGNLIEGVSALAGDHGIFLDDIDRDGADQVHLVLTGNTVRDHSGSGLLAVNKSASSTVRLGDPADPSLGNFFSANCRYNVELSRSIDNPFDLPNDLRVEARHNWWGVECSPGVSSTIFDRHAQQSVGLATVDLSPFTDSQLEPLVAPSACGGPFSPRELVFETGSITQDEPIALRLGFAVFAGEVELQSWVVRLPEETVFAGFPSGAAGQWSYTGLRQGSFELIGLSPDQGFFDRDGNGMFTTGDWLVLWRDHEFQVSFGMGAPTDLEDFTLDHRIDFAAGLFTNPSSVGSFPVESRWQSRDGRIECDAEVATVQCRVPESAVVGTIRVVKHPDGIRVFWPALNAGGLSCFAGYGLLGADDPWSPGAFTNRSALDTTGDEADTVFTGDPPETFLQVVAVGPDGQFGPVSPGLYLP